MRYVGTDCAFHSSLFVSPSLTCIVHYLVNSLQNKKVQEGVTRSIQRAKKFFLYDAGKHFDSHRIWFKTLYRQENGALTEALVIPQDKGAGDGFGVILPFDVLAPTHLVTNPDDGKEYPVRIKIFIKPDKPDGQGRVFDPFDYRFGKSVWVWTTLVLILCLLPFTSHSSLHVSAAPSCGSLRHESSLPSGKSQQSMGGCWLSCQ